MFLERVEFAGIGVLASPGRVMRPRPASEALVEAAVELLAGRAARVVDVGTGTGAIAVALALRAPDAEVWATDVDPTAVALARLNAGRHGVRVHVRRGDLLAPTAGRFDLIVANLPYLPLRERAEHPELRGEPLRAVFAVGDGLDPSRRLLHEAHDRLTPEGCVLLQLRGRVLAFRQAPAADEVLRAA